MPAVVAERSLAGELSLVDCLDGLLWQKDGRVTLVYSLTGWHEPALDDAQCDALAFMAEHVWSGLPEETTTNAAFPKSSSNMAGASLPQPRLSNSCGDGRATGQGHASAHGSDAT
jgi:hypothetical protein